MKILIAYATNSGGTYLASQIIESKLSLKHTVNIKRIDTVETVDLETVNLTIFASPTWLYNKKDGQPHDLFVAFMEKNATLSLPNKKFAILGLGDSSYTHFCGVVEHLENFVKKIGGSLLTESLKIDGYYFNEKNPEKVAQWSAELVKLTA